MVSGVAQVEVFGSVITRCASQLEAIFLAYRKISLDAVEAAITAQNANMPGRRAPRWRADARRTRCWRPVGSRTPRTPSRLLTVTEHNGAMVQLGMLGKVLDDVQNNQTASWFNGTRCHRARRATPAGFGTP